MKRSQDLKSNKPFAQKKLSEPLTYKEIKKLMKYMDVSTNTTNPLIRKSVQNSDVIKINPNFDFNPQIINKITDSAQKNNKISNDNEGLKEKNHEKANRFLSREEAVKSGSPVLWLKKRLHLEKIVVPKNNPFNIYKDNLMDRSDPSPIHKSSNSSTPDIKNKKTNSSSPMKIFTYYNTRFVQKVDYAKDNIIDSMQSNEFKTLIKGKNFTLEKKSSSPEKKLNDVAGKEETIEENFSSLDLSYNRSMKKDAEIEKNSQLTSEDSSQPNQIHTYSESYLLVKNDPFLNKETGKKIKFKAGEVIAEGSSSVVYKALNLENGSIFVVKRYNSVSDNKLLSTFMNEVKIFQNLDHPNIIKYYDSESIDKDLFVYLEYLPGGSIKSLLDKFGALDEKLIKIYLKQILYGISYLHNNGIVHRDLKCANILVDLKGNIKLSDFGCSGQLSNLNYADSQVLNSLKGTIPFMAPEVIRQSKYGRKADIWSIGCTALEMVTGKLPWGHFDNYFQALYKIGKSNDIPDFPLNISGSFKSFLLNCFKRDYKERPGINELLAHEFIN